MEIRVKFRKTPIETYLQKGIQFDIKELSENKQKLWIPAEDETRKIENNKHHGKTKTGRQTT